MSIIHWNHISFHYTTPYKEIFKDLNLTIQTTWRTGLIGRNGRGKTTLLNLLRGIELPDKGCVSMPVTAAYFPYEIMDHRMQTHEVIFCAAGPYREYEEKMTKLLADGSDKAMQEYGEIQEHYSATDGYSIGSLIAREAAECGLDEDILSRPFNTLSSGERTRALIAALFLRKNSYVILDEPTNHLDMEGRRMLARYLSRKNGFIVVSHDRCFLDECVDHIIALEKETIEIRQGNYSTWRYNKDLFDRFENEKNEHLKSEITQLKRVAHDRRMWSGHTEREKKSCFDSGYAGRLAAKMMKRALCAERRITKDLEEKERLFANREIERSLKLEIEQKVPDLMCAVYKLSCGFQEKIVFSDVSFAVHAGDRIAITGNNGCGKTTLLSVLLGVVPPLSGSVYLPLTSKVACSYQEPLWQKGNLKELINSAGLDPVRFRTILGSFGVCGEIFERPLEHFSAGELKKIELCRSFMEPAHILIWDEPLNYIDIKSREQIEKVILEHKPTMIFVEHDEVFIERVATQRLHLSI